jgi:hypothetical protein
MSTFSDEMSAVAQELITEFGEQVEFEHIEQGTYDPTSGEAFSDTITPYSGYIVTSDYKQSEIDGVQIQNGDIKVYAYQMSETPKVSDTLEFSDETIYRIMDVKISRVNGVNVLYTLQVRT